FTTTDVIASENHWHVRETRAHKDLADLDVCYAWILRYGWGWRGFVGHVRAARDAILGRSSIAHDLYVSQSHQVPGGFMAAARGGAVNAALVNYVFGVPTAVKAGLDADRIVCFMIDVQSRQHALARGAEIDSN